LDFALPQVEVGSSILHSVHHCMLVSLVCINWGMLCDVMASNLVETHDG